MTASTSTAAGPDAVDQGLVALEAHIRQQIVESVSQAFGEVFNKDLGRLCREALRVSGSRRQCPERRLK